MKRYYLYIVFFLNCLQSFSQEIWYYIDTSEVIESADDLRGKQLTKLNNESINLGFFDGQLWLKVIPSQNSGIIEFQNPNLDEIYVYQNNSLLFVAGDYYHANKKPIQGRFFRFPIFDKKHPIYVKIIHHGDQFFLPIHFTNYEEVKEFDVSDNFFNGVYYGLIIFILLLNLFMVIFIKEKNNLYYLLYILFMLFLQLSLSGYAYQFLWPHSSFLANHSLPFFAGLSVLFLNLFTIDFLQVKHINKSIYRFLQLINILLTATVLLSVIPNHFTYKTSILSVNAITLVLNILIIPISVISYKRGNNQAKFFILAFSVLIIAVFVFIMRNLGLIPSNNLTNNSLLIGSAFEVILLSFAIVDKFRSFKDESLKRLEEINELQSEQKELLEKEVAERTRELKEKSEKLAHRNKEVLDSLRYAKRIQTALIPSEEAFRSYFQDSFVLFKPKDIVSGDFYWINSVSTSYKDRPNKRMYVFALADCTGHGVPGAIISVIGLKILNQSLTNEAINSPAEALNFLNVEVSNTLNSGANFSEEAIKDGMDIALCAYDVQNKVLHYAGAKNPIYIIRNGELIELKADRNAIGNSDTDEPYTNKTIQLENGDMIYLFSDGYADQFGGPKGKKFKYKAFKQLLIKISGLPTSMQKTMLNNTFEDWIGNYEQIDDVSIIGIRIQ